MRKIKIQSKLLTAITVAALASVLTLTSVLLAFLFTSSNVKASSIVRKETVAVTVKAQLESGYADKVKVRYCNQDDSSYEFEFELTPANGFAVTQMLPVGTYTCTSKEAKLASISTEDLITLTDKSEVTVYVKPDNCPNGITQIQKDTRDLTLGEDTSPKFLLVSKIVLGAAVIFLFLVAVLSLALKKR